MKSPRIAIVIPAYGQPEYLAQAILSALGQSIAYETRIVVVNDGCPFASTDSIARFFATSAPGVRYLKTPNQGLSAARNAGIRFALDAWPPVEAIFPLDADNMLTTHTLEKLLAALEARPDAGWVYQDLQFFGIERAVAVQPRTFSLYRLLLGNFCDAGSLIRRAVFEHGIWFDESMRSGFEDWDFFLRAALDGFSGTHCAETGFLYRKRGHSMLSAATRERRAFGGVIAARTEARHPTRLGVLEHMEMPRFAIVEADTDSVRYASLDLDDANIERHSETLAADIAEGWGGGPTSDGYVPPMVVITTSALKRYLQAERLWTGMLFRLQQRCSSLGAAALAVEPLDSTGVSWAAREPRAPFDLVMVSTEALFNAASNPAPRAGPFPDGAGAATLRCGFQRSTPAPDLQAIADGIVARVADQLLRRPAATPVIETGTNNSLRSHELHLRPAHTFLPVLPGGKPGTRYVVAPAASVARATAVIDEDTIPGDAKPTILVACGPVAHFDLRGSSIAGGILLPDDARLSGLLQQVLEGADDIVTFDCTIPGETILALRATRSRRLTFAFSASVYLQTAASREFAEAARALEGHYDAFVVPTERAMHMAMDWGVPREKITIAAMPEAPAKPVPSTAAADVRGPAA